MRVVLVIGTRPEAVKMAPVIRELKARSSAGIESFVISTGQHQEMMQSILELFQIKPEFNLEVMRKGQSLTSLFSNVLVQIEEVYFKINPGIVLVHGDTTSAAAAALAAFHQKIKVGHIEAGLRTGSLDEPFPEESNRRIIALHTDVHFAPTAAARSQLIREGIPASQIVVTGNTVVDALQSVVARISREPSLRLQLDTKFSFLDGARDIILVTGHRRENLGNGLDGICEALIRLAEQPDFAIVYPVHSNPAVLERVSRRLHGRRNIYLIAPAGYAEFIYLMMRSSVILTDSGGVQEEAPSLAKPVLVMRNVTERREAIDAGLARLVGTEPERIVAAVHEILRESSRRVASRAPNPFGDGRAAERIVKALLAREAHDACRHVTDQQRQKIPARQLVSRVTNRIALAKLRRRASGMEVSAH